MPLSEYVYEQKIIYHLVIIYVSQNLFNLFASTEFCRFYIVPVFRFDHHLPAVRSIVRRSSDVPFYLLSYVRLSATAMGRFKSTNSV